jgi:hypothetical protein
MLKFVRYEIDHSLMKKEDFFARHVGALELAASALWFANLHIDCVDDTKICNYADEGADETLSKILGREVMSFFGLFTSSTAVVPPLLAPPSSTSSSSSTQTTTQTTNTSSSGGSGSSSSGLSSLLSGSPSPSPSSSPSASSASSSSVSVPVRRIVRTNLVAPNAPAAVVPGIKRRRDDGPVANPSNRPPIVRKLVGTTKPLSSSSS